jgi:hypothetical protein
MSRGKRILDFAGSALVAAMLSGALTLALSEAMGLSVPALELYALCGAVALILSIAAWSKGGAIAALAAVAAGVAGLAIFGGFRPVE